MPTFQPHGRISNLYSRHLCYCSLNICILDRKYHICFVWWYHLPYFYEYFEIIDSGHHVSKTSIAVLRASSCVFTQPTIGSEITIFNNMCMHSKCLNLSHGTVMHTWSHRLRICGLSIWCTVRVSFRSKVICYRRISHFHPFVVWFSWVSGEFYD